MPQAGLRCAVQKMLKRKGVAHQASCSRMNSLKISLASTLTAGEVLSREIFEHLLRLTTRVRPVEF